MKKSVFGEGFAAGVPIGLGYFAVSFSLGILAKGAGLSLAQCFWASVLNVASAGEYALFNSIGAKAAYLEIAAVTFVVNCRYFLMSCALSQKFDAKTPFFHRFFVGYGVTDEIFAISAAREGALNPRFNYGAICASIPMWAAGAAIGFAAGTYLPARIVAALSVSLYGMFVAIVVPEAKKDAAVAISAVAAALASGAFSALPQLSGVSGSVKTIIVTVAISAAAAAVKPVKDEEDCHV